MRTQHQMYRELSWSRLGVWLSFLYNNTCNIYTGERTSACGFHGILRLRIEENCDRLSARGLTLRVVPSKNSPWRPVMAAIPGLTLRASVRSFSSAPVSTTRMP
jgi:hypothetical protein